MSLTLRPADSGDASLILAFIQGLAAYEHLEAECVATEAAILATLFGPKPAAECLLAFQGEEPAGFALYFTNYSTFLAKPGLYLEDLFVKPTARGQGVGRALLLYLAKLANERGYGRMDWTVLDWNQPAIDFYQRIGAKPMAEWKIFRLTGAELAQYR